MSKKTIRAQAAAEEMNYRLSALNPLFTAPKESCMYSNWTFQPELAGVFHDFCQFFKFVSAILKIIQTYVVKKIRIIFI